MKCAITRSNGQSSTTYKEKPEFFHRTIELFTSSTGGPSYDILSRGITDDDRVELPFEFTWPERTELPPGEKWHPSEYFAHGPGGILPPTYIRLGSNEQLVEVGNKYHDSTTSSHLLTRYLRVWQYFLEARLFTHGRYSPAQESRCPLTYWPVFSMPGLSPLLPSAYPSKITRAIMALIRRMCTGGGSMSSLERST